MTTGEKIALAGLGVALGGSVLGQVIRWQVTEARFDDVVMTVKDLAERLDKLEDKR